MPSLLQTRIREKIEDANLTVAELERQANLPQGSVRKILAGNTKNPGIETIWSVAQVLQCRVDSLINENEIEMEYESSLNEKLPFVASLYSDCVTFAVHYFCENKVTLTFNEAFNIIKEIYMYSLEKPEPSLDKRFAQWILEKNYKK